MEQLENINQEVIRSTGQNMRRAIYIYINKSILLKHAIMEADIKY